jgi:hypothetical protein
MHDLSRNWIGKNSGFQTLLVLKEMPQGCSQHSPVLLAGFQDILTNSVLPSSSLPGLRQQVH